MRKTMLFVLVLFCLSFLTCCDDCPTCPEPETPTLGEYRLYAVNGYYNKIYTIKIPEDSIVDSIQFDSYCDFISVTPDGQKLLVGKYDNDSASDVMEVYNTSDYSYVSQLNQYGRYVFDGGDDYGICCDNISSVYFINTTTMMANDSIVFDLPEDVKIGHAYLDTVSNQYFCRTTPRYSLDSSIIIYIIDCISRRVTDSIITPYSWGRTVNVAYNWLTNDLYFQSFAGTGNSWFYQYDMDTDSIVSSVRIVSIGGSIAISPDGRRIYMTDAGNPWFGYPPEHPIWIFDALSHQLIQWVPIPVYQNIYISDALSYILPTPDGRRLYIANVSAGSPILVVDLETNSVTNIISTGPEFTSNYHVIGPVLNK